MENEHLNIKKIFKESWGLFLNNWKKYVPILAVIMILSAIVDGDGKNSSGISGIVSLMWTIIEFILVIGILNASLKVVRGISIKWADFWQPKYLFKILATAVLFAIPIFLIFMVAFGGLFLVLGNSVINILVASSVDPFILAEYAFAISLALIFVTIAVLVYSTRLYFYQFVVIDQGYFGIKALKESWNMTKGKAMKIFWLIVAIVIINILGVMLFFFGLLISLPLTFFALAYTYEEIYKDYHGNQSNLPEEKPIMLATNN